MLLALVAEREQRGLADERVVFRKIVDQLDVLVDRARVVLHAGESGDQPTTQGSNLGFAHIRRKGRIAEERNFVEVELLETMVVARLSVGIGHGSEGFSIIRRIRSDLRTAAERGALRKSVILSR